MKAKLLFSMALGLVAMAAPAPAFAEWHKGFVVDYFTDPGWKGGDKDANCPNGDSRQDPTTNRAPARVPNPAICPTNTRRDMAPLCCVAVTVTNR